VNKDHNLLTPKWGEGTFHLRRIPIKIRKLLFGNPNVKRDSGHNDHRRSKHWVKRLSGNRIETQCHTDILQITDKSERENEPLQRRKLAVTTLSKSSYWASSVGCNLGVCVCLSTDAIRTTWCVLFRVLTKPLNLNLSIREQLNQECRSFYKTTDLDSSKNKLKDKSKKMWEINLNEEGLKW
jgi:hypothetical protein